MGDQKQCWDVNLGKLPQGKGGLVTSVIRFHTPSFSGFQTKPCALSVGILRMFWTYPGHALRYSVTLKQDFVVFLGWSILAGECGRVSSTPNKMLLVGF
jgi:hypothetical protein